MDIIDIVLWAMIIAIIIAVVVFVLKKFGGRGGEGNGDSGFAFMNETRDECLGGGD